jgi:hypothetical protein
LRDASPQDEIGRDQSEQNRQIEWIPGRIEREARGDQPGEREGAPEAALDDVESGDRDR